MSKRQRIESGSIIQFQEWQGWRLVGNGKTWQLQQHDGNCWKPRQSFPSLLSAALAAYDYALMGMGFEVDSIRDLYTLCETTRDQLTKAIKEVTAL